MRYELTDHDWAAIKPARKTAAGAGPVCGQKRSPDRVDRPGRLSRDNLGRRYLTDSGLPLQADPALGIGYPRGS
jgi:hypothetical protein